MTPKVAVGRSSTLTEPALDALVMRAYFPDNVIDAVQQAALSEPRYHAALACSPQLTDSAWYALYKTKPLPPWTLAAELVNRPLTRDQIDHVTTHETRSSIVLKVMERYELSPVAQDRLAGGRALTDVTALALIAAPWATPSAKRTAAYARGGQVMLEWLAYASPQEVSNDEVATLIATYPQWQPVSRSTQPDKLQAEAELIATRPELLRNFIACGPTSTLCTALAASHRLNTPTNADALFETLVDYVMSTPTPVARRVHTVAMALADLIANPVVPSTLATQAYEFATTHRMLRAAPGRALRAADSFRHQAANALSTRHQILITQAGLDNTPRSHRLVAEFDSQVRDGAIIAPFDELTDGYLITVAINRVESVHAHTVLADLARNKNLGIQAAEIARRLATSTDTHPMLASARLVFAANFPHLADRVNPTPPLTPHYPPHSEPQYLPRYCPEPITTATGIPERYEYPLALVPAYWSSAAIATGIADYISAHLGPDVRAWTTLLCVADSFADSDIATLTETVLALHAADSPPQPPPTPDPVPATSPIG
jgi:hypothetical protein